MDLLFLLSIIAIVLAALMTLFQFAELLQRFGIKLPFGANSWILALLSTLGYAYIGWYYEAWGQVVLCVLSTIIITLIIYKDGAINVNDVQRT